MNKYACVALKAAEYVENKQSPEDAWEQASCEIFGEGTSSQKKTCPKNAFLGLYNCNNTTKNAEYAREAMEYLLERYPNQNADMATRELWKKVLEKLSEDLSKTHNQQMNVVLALYNSGRRGQPPRCL
jgi:benzoyl-CoA reductase/2-hydroxyglutaryl-CoA dehydratase subunit BcrC/BadD/HgdB